MPKILEAAFSNYDEFKKQPYTTQYDAALNFFDRYIADDKFKALPPEDRVAYKRGFIDNEVGSSVSGEGTLTGFFTTALRDGLSQVTNLAGSVAELGASFNPLSVSNPDYNGPFDAEMFAEMVDWFDQKAQEFAPNRRPTGRYAIPPKTVAEHLDPKRWGHAALSNAPLMATLMASYSVNPAAGTALMGVAEGGDLMTEMRKAQEAGKEIPLWQAKGIPLMVGTANALLERIFPAYVLKRAAPGVRAAMKKAVMGGLIEGVTEGAQELAPILADMAMEDPDLDVDSIIDRFHMAIYEGAASGGVFGAGAGVFHTEPRAEDVAEDVEPGTRIETAQGGGFVASTPLVNLATEYSKAVADVNSISTAVSHAEERQTAEAYAEEMRNSIVQFYRIEQPDDLAGEGLEKMLVALQVPTADIINRLRADIIPETTKSKRVKLPHSLEEGRTFTYRMPTPKGPHNITVRARRELPVKTGKTIMERTLTALNINRDRFADIANRISDVVVMPDKASDWVPAAIEEGTLYTPKPIRDGKAFIQTLKDSDAYKYAKADLEILSKRQGLFIELPNGSYRILLRGMAKVGDKKATPVDYAKLLGHEIEHARAASERGVSIRQLTIDEVAQARAVEEPRAEKAQIAIGQATQKVTNLHKPLLFSARQNDRVTNPAFEEQQTLKLINSVGLGGAFSSIRLAQGQLFMPVEDGGKVSMQEVNGFVDPGTRTLWLSAEMDPGTVGHEATELVANTLGWDNNIVKRGIELFDGDKEKLMQAVGEYYENRQLEPSLVKRIAQWLKDLWSEFNRLRGAELAEQDILNLMNERIASRRHFASSEKVASLQNRYAFTARLAEKWEKTADKRLPNSPEREHALETAQQFKALQQDLMRQLKAELTPLYSLRAGRVPISLKAYNNFDKPGAINLQNLFDKGDTQYFKGLKKSEAEYVKAILEDAYLSGLNKISHERATDALLALSLPVSIEPEPTRAPDQPTWLTTERAAWGSVIKAKTNKRWMFTVPVDLVYAAHPAAGLYQNNAIGWVEVADSEVEPHQLVVIEVQPSDYMKQVRRYGARGRQSVGDILQSSMLQAMAPSTNQIMYRETLRNAAENGYNSVLLPTPETALVLEGLGNSPTYLFKYKGQDAEFTWSVGGEALEAWANGKKVASIPTGIHASAQDNQAINLINEAHTNRRLPATKTTDIKDAVRHYGLDLIEQPHPLGKVYEIQNRRVRKDNPGRTSIVKQGVVNGKELSWLKVDIGEAQAEGPVYLFSKKKQRLGRGLAELVDKQVDYPDLGETVLATSAERSSERLQKIEKELSPEYIEAMLKRKRTPGTAGIYYGSGRYGQKKAVQNFFSMAPESVRETIERIALRPPFRESHDPNIQRTYGEYQSQYPDWDVDLKLKASELSQDYELMEELKKKVDKGHQLSAIEGRALKLALEQRAVSHAKVMAYENPDTWRQQALMLELQKDIYYHEAVNVRAGQAVAALDVREEAGKWDLFGNMRLAMTGGLGKYGEDFLAAVAEQDYDTARNIRENYLKRHASKTKKLGGVLQSIMYEGMLAPVAFGKNLASNTLWLEMNVGVLRPGVAGVDKVLNSALFKKLFPSLAERERQTYLPEAAAMQAVLKPGSGAYTRAWKEVKDAWRSGHSKYHTKWELEIGTIGDSYRTLFAERDVPEGVVKGLTLFSHGMMLTDVFFKSLAFDAEIEAQVTRDMQKTGKMRQEVEVTKEMKEAARRFADYATFMDNPQELAQSAYSFRAALKRWGLPGRAIIPFVNTLCNILQRGVEFTPGFGVAAATPAIRREMASIAKERKAAGEGLQVRATDTKAFTNMIAMQIAGTLATFALYSALYKGDDEDERITGGPPREARARAQFYATKKPYSIRVGDSWVSYRDFEPINIWLSSIVHFRDALRDAKEGDAKEGDAEGMTAATEAFTNAVGAVVGNIFESSYMDNVVQLFDDGLNVSVLGRIPANFVPYSAFMRRTARTLQVADTGEYVIYENRSLFSALANVLPWTNEESAFLKKEGRLTALGEEMTAQVGKPGLLRWTTLSQWLPFSVSEVYTDAVEDELFELDIYPGLPQKTMQIRGEQVTFDDGFYREYALLYGKYTKEAIEKAIASQSYQSLSAESRRKLLSRRISVARRRARLIGQREWLASHEPNQEEAL